MRKLPAFALTFGPVFIIQSTESHKINDHIMELLILINGQRTIARVQLKLPGHSNSLKTARRSVESIHTRRRQSQVVLVRFTFKSHSDLLR